MDEKILIAYQISPRGKYLAMLDFKRGMMVTKSMRGHYRIEPMSYRSPIELNKGSMAAIFPIRYEQLKNSLSSDEEKENVRLTINFWKRHRKKFEEQTAALAQGPFGYSISGRQE